MGSSKTGNPKQDDELRPEYERSDFGALVRGKYADRSDIPELTDEQFARALPARIRRRLIQGQIESGEDIAVLRRFVGLTQVQFALAMGISVHTLRNWEQGRRHPEGPAIALLRIAARHPQLLALPARSEAAGGSRSPGVPEIRFELRAQAFSSLDAWNQVYEGLSDDEIAEVESMALDRSRFSRVKP